QRDRGRKGLGSGIKFGQCSRPLSALTRVFIVAVKVDGKRAPERSTAFTPNTEAAPALASGRREELRGEAAAVSSPARVAARGYHPLHAQVFLVHCLPARKNEPTPIFPLASLSG